MVKQVLTFSSILVSSITRLHW